MGVRSARLSDVLTVRALDFDAGARVVYPAVGAAQPSATAMALMSSWRGMGYRAHTLVLRSDGSTRGFVQARARPGRESWDIVRLTCVAPDVERWERGCADLLDSIGVATAQRGALRTFARVPSDSDALGLLTDTGFRPYATELTQLGTLRALVAAAPTPRADVRPRLPRDAWDIFSLYCAITPALVRHAEGRSLKEWAGLSGLAGRTVGHRRYRREVVVGEPGHLQAWIRWSPGSPHKPQVLEVLVRPEAVERLGEVVRFATELLRLDPDCPTMCRAREYDGRISATLESVGFDAVLRETLLVRHTVARVTERQLLIAALRAQGLGIDISHYGHGAKPVHQRLASSRRVRHHCYEGTRNY